MMDLQFLLPFVLPTISELREFMKDCVPLGTTTSTRLSLQVGQAGSALALAFLVVNQADRYNRIATLTLQRYLNILNFYT